MGLCKGAKQMNEAIKFILVFALISILLYFMFRIVIFWIIGNEGINCFVHTINATRDYRLCKLAGYI